MKAKLLKKIRKRYKIIKNDHSGIEALDHNLKRVPKWKNITDFMITIISEHYGIISSIHWEERKIRRKNRNEYRKLNQQ